MVTQQNARTVVHEILARAVASHLSGTPVVRQNSVGRTP